jgi:NhaP-type Na+/H+ and K+/H+ antiporter
VEIGDHVFFVLTRGVRPLVERLFTRSREDEETAPAELEYQMRGDTRLADLAEFYGVPVEPEDEAVTLDELLRRRLGERLAPGRGVELGAVKLRVDAMLDGRVERVGVVVRADGG